MNTIKLNLNVEAFDCYIYGGHLFIFLKDGSIGCLSFNKVYRQLYNEYPYFVDYFRLIFQRNDYFKNKQGVSLFNIPELKSAFTKTWDKISKIIEFEYDIDDILILAKIPESDLPILDVKIYGMKVFVATLKGLYSMSLGSVNNQFVKIGAIKKRFDAKSIYLNAKCGSLAISTNNDGLFHGSIHGDNPLKVNEKEISKKSIRTSWVNFDLVNYETNKDFEYLENQVDQYEELNKYSFRDEKKEKNIISNFGVNRISNHNLVKNLNLKEESIKYAFNSSKSVFFITNKGNFYNSNILIEKNSLNDILDDNGIMANNMSTRKDIRMSSKIFQLPRVKRKKTIKPLSSHIIEKGCVLEFMDKIVLFRDNKAVIVDNDPAINLRSYPSSLRYKNLITVTKLNKITIHSIFPY